MKPSPPQRPSEKRFADLRAVVYPCSVPEGAAAELRSLYSSLFATLDWFETHDDPGPMGVCTLDDPRHVVFVHVAGDTVEVLNKAFAIAPADARRTCAALFRAFPAIHRIHLEVMFPARELALPHRTLYWTDHMVIDLPETVEEYLTTLGKRTRGHLRYYERRLRRDHPSVTTEIVQPGEDSPSLFNLFLRWKSSRFHARGRRTYWDDDPRLRERFVALLERCGEAHVTSIAGDPAAVRFVFPVGAATCMQESAFAPVYDQYRLGFLTLFWVIRDAIGRGATSINLLWGTTEFKELLGAVPRRATALSVFRTQSSRLWSIGEATEVMRRRAKRGAQRYYWEVRHAARHALDRVLRKDS